MPCGKWISLVDTGVVFQFWTEKGMGVSPGREGLVCASPRSLGNHIQNELMNAHI